MSDLHDDALVAGAFAAFRADVAPHVRPAGTTAAHETVRHRRRVRTIAATALAVLVIGVPVVAYAAVEGDPHGPPSVPATGGPTASPSAAQPSPSQSLSASASPTTPPPDGRITQSDLGKATLRLPAWGPDDTTRLCPTGAVAFTSGRHHIADSEDVAIDDVVYADVDHDGAQETVVRLSCGGQGNTFQVVAFDRDPSGAIVTIGQVTVDSDTIRAICGLRAGADGTTVEAEVGDYPLPLLCGDGTTEPAQFQWRSYGFDGTGFSQTAGPASFPVNPKVTDLKVTATDLTFAAAPAGGYRGTMTVTVKNAGQSPMAYKLGISVQSGVQVVAPTGCAAQTYPQPVEDISCPQGSLAAGATRTVTFQLTTNSTATPDFLPAAGVMLSEGYGDWNENDNHAQFTVKF